MRCAKPRSAICCSGDAFSSTMITAFAGIEPGTEWHICQGKKPGEPAGKDEQTERRQVARGRQTDIDVESSRRPAVRVLEMPPEAALQQLVAHVERREQDRANAHLRGRRTLCIAPIDYFTLPFTTFAVTTGFPPHSSAASPTTTRDASTAIGIVKNLSTSSCSAGAAPVVPESVTRSPGVA